mmetsp:Transcript_9020/g.14776  ORF Transcript_9020/g.14776 Transcript_9020/m.14776 type:complete len:461 (+) Transcript_9020:57-1439(+)
MSSCSCIPFRRNDAKGRNSKNADSKNHQESPDRQSRKEDSTRSSPAPKVDTALATPFVSSLHSETLSKEMFSQGIPVQEILTDAIVMSRAVSPLEQPISNLSPSNLIALLKDALILEKPESSLQNVLAAIKKVEGVKLTELATDALADDVLSDALTNSICKKEAGQEDRLCAWLYDWYYSANTACQHFVARFIPALFYCYLTSLAANRLPPVSVETVLLGIYNHEVTHNGKVPRVDTPQYKQPSSPSVPSPMVAHREITPASWPSVSMVCLLKFSDTLSDLPIKAHQDFCLLSNRLLRAGYPNLQLGRGASSLELLESGEGPGPLSLFKDDGKVSPRGGAGTGARALSSTLAGLVRKTSASFRSASSGKLRKNTVSAPNASPDRRDPSFNMSAFVDNSDEIRFKVPIGTPLLQTMLSIFVACQQNSESRSYANNAIEGLQNRASYDLIPELMLATSMETK